MAFHYHNNFVGCVNCWPRPGCLCGIGGDTDEELTPRSDPGSPPQSPNRILEDIDEGAVLNNLDIAFINEVNDILEWDDDVEENIDFSDIRDIDDLINDLIEWDDDINDLDIEWDDDINDLDIEWGTIINETVIEPVIEPDIEPESHDAAGIIAYRTEQRALGEQYSVFQNIGDTPEESINL
jgi:hypothetical protein